MCVSFLLILSLGGEVQRGIAGHTTGNSLAVEGAHYPPTYEFAHSRRSLLVHADSVECDPAACDPDACGMNGDTNGDCVFNANDLLYLENVFNRQNDGTADQLDAMVGGVLRTGFAENGGSLCTIVSSSPAIQPSLARSRTPIIENKHSTGAEYPTSSVQSAHMYEHSP